MNDITQGLIVALRLIVTFDAELWEIGLRSLQVSLTAVIIASAVAMPFGAFLAVQRFKYRRLVVSIMNALMGLPPIVVVLIFYILSDRASWLNFKNKGDLALLFSGDPVLFNQYAYLPVNPAKHPTVQYGMAMQLEEWLLSDKSAALINNYQINGETLFVFNGQK